MRRPGTVLDHPIELHPVPPAPSESTKKIPPRVRKSPWLVMTVVAVLLIPATYALFRSARETAFDRFWSPVLKAPNRSVIYVGSNAVYYLSGDFVDRYRRDHQLDKVESMGREFLVPLARTTSSTARISSLKKTLTSLWETLPRRQGSHPFFPCVRNPMTCALAGICRWAIFGSGRRFLSGGSIIHGPSK